MDTTIQIIDSIEKLEGFLPEWLAFLETRPLGMTVYNDPRFILTQLKYDFAGVKNRQLHIVVVREGETIRCIAPLSIRDHSFRFEVSVKKFFPVKTQQMQCFGGSFLYADQPEMYDKYFEAVFKELKQSKIHFDFLYFMGFRRNSPFWRYCQSHLTGQPFRLLEVLAEMQHDLRIQLPDSIEMLLSGIDKKQRYNIRRAVKHFMTKVQSSELLRITEASQIESFFESVSEISRNSWQGKTFGHTDWKTDVRCQCWKKLATEGLLRSYLLLADGHPIAYRIGYQYAGTYYTQESRFDQKYQELTPGLVCLYRCLEDIMMINPADVFDFDFGTLGNKRIFANEEIESMTVYITATWKGTFLARTQKAINHFVFRCKRLLERWKIAERIRKILHHKKT
ncbi:MAG: GNAT family N-acetyltransferase [Planctomycetaceae bacterium]|nr:GNAT family N-acetyltransferase [Planctomycetaceae bacterium]